MVAVHFVHSAGRRGVWREVIKASQTNGRHTVLTAWLSFSRVSIRFTISSKSCFWNKQSNTPYALQPVSQQHVHCSYSVPHLHQIPIIIITTIKCYLLLQHSQSAAIHFSKYIKQFAQNAHFQNPIFQDWLNNAMSTEWTLLTVVFKKVWYSLRLLTNSQ